MSRLIPCASCSRHVRQAEGSCPFCGGALSLASVPPAPLPRKRLGRAATFAFGASVVGATTLVACGDDAEPDPVPVPVYGAPAAGTWSGPGQGGEGGQGGAAPTDFNGEGGEARAVYGAPPGGEGSK